MITERAPAVGMASRWGMWITRWRRSVTERTVDGTFCDR